MSTNTLRMVRPTVRRAAAGRAPRYPRTVHDARRRRPAMKDSSDLMSATTRASRDRVPRLRRLPPGRLRVVLPQRDRPAAGHAGRDPGRHHGRVRHRLRRRHRLAALAAYATAPGSSPPSWTRELADRGGRDLPRRRPAVEVLAADWSTLLDKGPYSLLFLDSGEPDGGARRRGRRPRRGGRHRRARRLHAVRDVAARSPTAGSTPCARSGSPTSASPPSR